MKTFLIITKSDGMYRLTEEAEGRKLTLKYSELDKSLFDKYEGITLATLLNDGNNITITMNNKKLKLDFCQVEELLTLLLHEREISDSKFTYKKMELKDCE